MANAQIARQQLTQAQQRITSQRQRLEEQRRQVAKARMPILTREQLKKQTPITAARYRGQAKQLVQRRTKALEQIKGAESEVAKYESRVIRPFETKVVAAEKIVAEQRAFKQAQKLYSKRIPYYFVSGLEKKYLKKMYSSAAAAKSAYHQKLQIFQKQYPGEKLMFEGGKLVGVASEALQMSVLPEHYGEALARVQSGVPDFGMSTVGLSSVQQMGISMPSVMAPTIYGPQLPEGWVKPDIPPPKPTPTEMLSRLFTGAPEKGVISPYAGTPVPVVKEVERIVPEIVPTFVEKVPEYFAKGVEFVEPGIEYVAKQPVISTALDMPAFTPGISIGPPGIIDRDITVGEVMARVPRTSAFLAQMAAKGAEISYEETIAKLPPELRPGRLVSTGEEYRQIMEDVRTGKVKREDVDWSQYIIPYTPEEFGKVVGVGATVAPYAIPGAAPFLLAADVVAARQDYQDAPELAKKEAESSYKDYIKTDLEEGEEHVSKEEYMNIVVPQFETEIKNQASVAMGVSGGVLVLSALWKVGSVLKKFVPRKKFTFGGRKMSQAKYDKLMKQIEQSRIDVAKQEAQVLKLRVEREPLVPKVKMDTFGIGKQKEVIGSVEKLTMADDLFNLKVFKTEKEAVKFVEGMTKTRTGIKRGFLEKSGLPKVPEAYITRADSFTLSSSLSTARGDKMVQFSYQLGAQGKPINVHLQLVTIPKGSKHSEILFYKAGRSRVKTFEKDGLIIKREIHDPYILVDKLVADVGKIKVGKIDETIWRMYQPNFRKVKFKKTRVSHYELLDDWVDKIPPKAELKSLFEAGKKVEKHIIIERLSPTGIEPRLSLVGRKDLFGVRAEVVRPYDVTIWGVGKKEAPELIKIPPWMKKVPSKPKPTPPVVFEVIPLKPKVPQILVTKEVVALKLPPPTLIPPPPKIKVPTPIIKVTPPVTKVGEGLPYMVGGLGVAIPDIKVMAPPKIGVEIIDRDPDKVLDIDLVPLKVGVTDWGAGLARDRIDITPRVISDMRLGLGIKSALEIKPVTKLEPITMMFQPTVIKPIVKPISRVVQVPRVVHVPRLRAVQVAITPTIARVTPIITPRITPRPPKKPVKYPPKRKFEFPRRPRRPPVKTLPKEKGYGIEIRRKKKWVRIHLPYAFATKEGAHAVGMARTVKEAAASYRVVKSLKPVKRTRKRPSPYHKVLFRPGKEKGVMVQKKLLRITSPGEIREISLKGAAARRGGQTWGIGKPKKVVNSEQSSLRKKKSTKKKKKKEVNKISYKKQKIRDGTGPYKESYQKMKVGIGKRKKKGEVCPIVKIKKSKKKGGKK